MSVTQVAILISGGGSNMLALARSMQGDPAAHPCLVLSNDPAAAGLDRAAALGIPVAAVDHRPFGKDRARFEQALHARLLEAGAEVICLAGFMRILTAEFVSHWAGHLLNIHPSLLPAYKGLNTHARVLADGGQMHGCTVHEVTADLDDGPILGQARLQVAADDTAQSLAARVLTLEHQLYPAVLHRFVRKDRRPVML